MLKIDEKIHWNLSNSSLIVYQDTWHYTSQWPSRQRQRQRQQEGWSSAPPLSLGEVFVRFAPFFPQISWHLVIFSTDPLIDHVFTNLFSLKCIDNFFTNTCRRNPSGPHAAPLRWLKTVFRWKCWQKNINLVPQFRNDGLVRYNVIFFILKRQDLFWDVNSQARALDDVCFVTLILHFIKFISILY